MTWYCRCWWVRVWAIGVGAALTQTRAGEFNAEIGGGR